MITAGILAGAAAIYVTNYAKNNAEEMDLYSLKYNQNQTTILYYYDEDQNIQELARLHGVEDRIWIDFDKIPERLQQAFIAIEDERFYTHKGVDWKRTIGAFANLFLGIYDSTQGGSTITQQLVKNVTGENDVTIIRKVNEIFTALELEKNYDKDVILEAYLNTVYLGQGAYGVQAASEKYFGKDPMDLNLAECACIAAITQYPYQNDPLNNLEGNRERKEYCLYKMLELGYITQEEYDEAMNYELVFADGSTQTEDTEGETEDNTSTGNSQSFYVDFVIDEVANGLAEKYGISKDEAVNRIYTGGLRINTAVDVRIQSILEDVYLNYDGVNWSDGSDLGQEDAEAQSAMVVMEYDGRVAGIIGQAGVKGGDRCLNRATQSVRSPGSAIKPLSIYGPAIEYNLVTWSTKIPDQPIVVPGEGRWPVNYNHVYGPDTTVQKGIEVSLNTLPARILQKLSFDTSYEFLTEKFHLEHLTESDKAYSPLATGGMSYGVTTLEMTAAYQAFGNGGVYNEPYCYYEVRDAANEVILSHESNPENVMSGSSATVMNKLLQTVMTGSSGSARNYTIPNQQGFAKTGTTTDNKDRYFMGGTPYYVAGCWYGYDIQQRIRSSGNPAGRIWDRVMTEIHEDLPRKSFDVSSGVVSRSYCVGSGLLASDACASTATGWYKTSNLEAVCQGGVHCWENESRPDLLASGVIPPSSSSTPSVPSTPSSQAGTSSTTSQTESTAESNTSSSTSTPTTSGEGEG